MSHTPGPWTYSTWRHADGIAGADVYAGEAWVASIHDSHGTSEGFPKDSEMLPNARLIAAAWDMLEALKVAMITMEAEGYPRAAQAIANVIAKATGGAE